MSIFNLSKFAGVLLLVWIASFPAAELFFRVMGDRAADDLAGLFSTFVDGSYKLAPRVETHAAWSAGKFSVYTDGLGLRCDRELRLSTKRGDRLDGIILGDSQGFGNGVDFEESISGIVATLAASEGLRIANASVGGHAARNQLTLARWLRDKQNVSTSTYILLATPLMVTYSDSFNRSFVGPDGRLYNSPLGPAAITRLWLKTHTVVYNRLRDAARNSGIGSRPNEDADQVLQIYGAGEPEAAVRTKFTSFLKEAKEFAQARGAKLVVVYVPLTVEADFGSMRRAAEIRGTSLDPDLPSRICFSAASDLSIPTHDLRPVLRKLHALGEPLRLKGDFHYDRVLSRACGETLWSSLKPQIKANGHSTDQSNIKKNTYGQ